MGLVASNLLVLALVAARAAPEGAPVEVLRGRALELTDERGRVRAMLDVDEAGEVVLRLIDRNGTIRVKLGAGEHGSALLLIDETTEPAVHVVARREPTPGRPNTTGITLRGAGGEARVIRPIEDHDAVLTTRIEVLDVARQEVLASVFLPQVVIAFVEPDLLASYGRHQIRLSRSTKPHRACASHASSGRSPLHGSPRFLTTNHGCRGPFALPPHDIASNARR